RARGKHMRPCVRQCSSLGGREKCAHKNIVPDHVGEQVEASPTFGRKRVDAGGADTLPGRRKYVLNRIVALHCPRRLARIVECSWRNRAHITFSKSSCKCPRHFDGQQYIRV